MKKRRRGAGQRSKNLDGEKGEEVMKGGKCVIVGARKDKKR